MGKEPYLRRMWEHFLPRKKQSKEVSGAGRQENKVSGSKESPASEYVEQVKCSHDTDCNERMMKKGFRPQRMGRGKHLKKLSGRR